MHFFFHQSQNFRNLIKKIKSKNRLWILDQGKVGGNAAEPGDIKLVVWDLDKNELIDTVVIPETVASLNNSFLNDLVVDDSSNIAFISDSGIPVDPTIGIEGFESGIIVLDLDDPTSAKKELFQFPQTLPDPNLWIKIDFDRPCLSNSPMRTGIDGFTNIFFVLYQNFSNILKIEQELHFLVTRNAFIGLP